MGFLRWLVSVLEVPLSNHPSQNGDSSWAVLRVAYCDSPRAHLAAVWAVCVTASTEMSELEREPGRGVMNNATAKNDRVWVPC